MRSGRERARLILGVRRGVEAKGASVKESAGVHELDVARGASLPGDARDVGADEDEATIRKGCAIVHRGGNASGWIVEQRLERCCTGLRRDRKCNGIGVAGRVGAVSGVVSLDRIATTRKLAERGAVTPALKRSALNGPVGRKSIDGDVSSRCAKG